jgi:hypothetical protein
VLVSVLGFTKWQVDDLYKKPDGIRVPRESKGLGDKMKDWWERLKWPMRKEECEKAMEELRRLAGYFQFSLVASNWFVLIPRWKGTLLTRLVI